MSCYDEPFQLYQNYFEIYVTLTIFRAMPCRHVEEAYSSFPVGSPCPQNVMYAFNALSSTEVD